MEFLVCYYYLIENYIWVCVCVMCIHVYHGVYVDVTGQLAGICSPTTRVLSVELSLASVCLYLLSHLAFLQRII